jgi:hypothetical protein
MPIEKAFNFQSEADFISRFLVPLLRRLGYSIVAEHHGQREFGRDLVFGEIDRFGEAAYHGLQAKYQDSISQSNSEKLIDDCRQAFRNPFRHPNTGAEHRISDFVVANAGTIADNARDNFFRAATNDEHGGNVRVFDGKALLALDRWATISRVEDVRETLSGLLIELRFNREILNAIEPMLRQFITNPASALPTERLLTSAASHYLAAPRMPSVIDTDELQRYRFVAERHLNARLDYLTAPGTHEQKASHGGELLHAFTDCKTWVERLVDTIEAALQHLGPLAAL